MKRNRIPLRLLLALTAVALWVLLPMGSAVASDDQTPLPGEFQVEEDDGPPGEDHGGSGTGGGLNADPNQWDVDDHRVAYGPIDDTPAQDPVPRTWSRLLGWLRVTLTALDAVHFGR